MDPAKQQAITGCGTCGQPEDAHKFDGSVDPGDLAVFAALGGPCTRFTVSDAAVIYLKHLAIADHRAPAPRKPGAPVGRRAPLCARCGHRGHTKETCPL